MTDTAAPKDACPVCGRVPATGSGADDEDGCPACGTPIAVADPIRLAEDALRRQAGAGGWLIDEDV